MYFTSRSAPRYEDAPRFVVAASYPRSHRSNSKVLSRDLSFPSIMIEAAKYLEPSSDEKCQMEEIREAHCQETIDEEFPGLVENKKPSPWDIYRPAVG